MAAGTVIQVLISRDGRTVGTELFERPRIMVGRDSDSADLVLSSSHVSRRHAVIEHDGTRVFVADAGSKNGIFVNDRRTKRMEVGAADVVAIGDFTLRLELLPAERAAQVEARPQLHDVIAQSSTLDAARLDELAGSAAPAYEPGKTGDLDLGFLATPLPPAAPAEEGTRQEAIPDALPPAPRRGLAAALGRRGGAAGDGDDGPAAHAGGPAAHAGSPAAHAGSGADHDDHDDEDADFAPAYSLAKQVLTDAQGLADDGASPRLRLEVLTVVRDRLVDFTLLRPGRVVWQRLPGAAQGEPALGLRSVHYAASGECEVVCDEDVQAKLRRGSETLTAKTFLHPRAPHGSRGIMRHGDLLSLNNGRASYYLRFVEPPTVPADSRGWLRRTFLDGQLFNIALGSLLAHLVLLITVSLFAGGEAPPAPKQEEFTVTTKPEMALQEPPPKPPEPPKAPEPPKPPEPPAPRKPERHVVHKSPVRRPPRAQPTPTPPPTPAPPGILGLLSKKGATQAPGPNAAVQAVANLTSVKVPGGGGSFRVSGLIGKMTTSSGLSAGGGGGIVTKGGAAALRGGAGRLQDRGDRRVGGLVQKSARAMQTTGAGSLDRAQIEKVVNEHTDDIQRCYEKELLHDASLAGKVQVEWVVGLDGRVPQVRQMFSSVKSVAVVKCIMDAIRTWHFPRPTGGQVVVNYPFILKGVDF